VNRRDLLAHASAAVGSALGSALACASGPASAAVRPRVRRRTRERAAQDTYQNPVYDHVFPDPDVLRVGDTYYAYGTYHPWTEGEGPDRELVPILRSPNLVDWEFVGPAFESMPDWSQYRGLWAPGVGQFGDRTVLYYSDSEFGAANPGIGVASAARSAADTRVARDSVPRSVRAGKAREQTGRNDPRATAPDPTGPFEPRGGLFRSEEVGVPNSIDPAVFVRDGKPYLFWGSHRGIYGIELAADGLSTAAGTDGSSVAPDAKFQIAGGGVEAPYVVERGDFFYFFGSRGTCCAGAESTYHVVVGRADEFRGPYRNRDGEPLTAEGANGTTILDGGERFLAPGHCAVVRDRNGGWWMLYHAYVAGNAWVGDTPRRVLMLDRIRWEDGWPVVGEDGTPSAEGRVPPVGE